MELVNAETRSRPPVVYRRRTRHLRLAHKRQRRLKITNSRVFDNTQEEIWLEATNDNVTVTGSTLYDTVNSGNTNYAAIYLAGNTTLVENNEIYQQGTGMWLAGKANTGARKPRPRQYARRRHLPGRHRRHGLHGDEQRLVGNLDGIDIQSSGTTTIVENNQVYSNSRYGIYLVWALLPAATWSPPAPIPASCWTTARWPRTTRSSLIRTASQPIGTASEHDPQQSSVQQHRVRHRRIPRILDRRQHGIRQSDLHRGLLFSPFTGDILNNVIYNNSVRGISVERGVSVCGQEQFDTSGKASASISVIARRTWNWQ